MFNEFFPNAEKALEEKVKAAVEAGSGIGVGKARPPAAGVGVGAGVSGTGSPSLTAASSSKASSRPASSAATTSSPTNTASSKVAGGSKSPSTTTSSPKAKPKASKRNSVSKKATKRNGASASPSMPPSNATTSASGAPNTSSAPTPTSLPAASTSTASALPTSSSGLSTGMATATTTMGSADSGLSGNGTGVGIGTGLPVGVGQEVVGAQGYGIGVVGAVVDTTLAKPRVALGHAVVQVPSEVGGSGAAVLQQAMYHAPPPGSSGSAMGYATAPQQAGLPPQYSHQYQQYPEQVQTHQLHQSAYLLPSHSHVQSPVTSPVVDNAGRYQSLAMGPPSHPPHLMSMAPAQYDDGSDTGGYYPSSHYPPSLDSVPAAGTSMAPNSLAGWAG
ncbi:hypothetical protein NMY22_g7835 [Coprinellus aureogranulatus]|nr:hypothetical protein NMY22_g7835 [Coprinellus aureogranulatus]